MNSLIIIPSECVEPDRAELTGDRARYAFDTHGIREGQEIRVGILGGRRGNASVVKASFERVVLNLSVLESSHPVLKLDLIVGISRPQTVKKVIQAAAILGVRSLHFVRSEQGEKSYLQSTSLSEEQVQFEVLKGLEQVWETHPPQIKIHRTFSYFCEYHLPSLDGVSSLQPRARIALVAHPGGEVAARMLEAGTIPRDPSDISVAIGPERGWSGAEVERLNQAGFHTVGLGERVMRVELAVVYLMGQLSALSLIP